MNSKVYCAILSILLVFFNCSSPESDTKTNDKFCLVWSDDPATTITIAWNQIDLCNPVVYYGDRDFGRKWKKYPLSQKPTRRNKKYRDMNTHFAKLTGLKPDMAYYFVIKDDSTVSRRFWFRTAPDKPQPFTFVTGGDTKSSGTALEAGRLSNKMVAKLRPLFVIFNGDFTSGDGTNAKRWQLWLDDWAALTTTKDGRMIPVVPVHGNHENGDKTVLYNLFDVPYQNGDQENIYYSVSFGGDLLHVIALNSQIDQGGAQKEWLEKNLSDHQHFSFKMTCFHKPFRPHTAGKSENDYQYAQWTPLFLRYQVDLAIDADSHMSKITYPVKPSDEPGSHEGFIRDDELGTMYVGEGSWGASPRANNDDKPWTLRSGSFNQIKWWHVFPGTEDRTARVDIHTIITATKNDSGQIVSHVDDVAELSEEDLFTLPANIDLFSTEPHGAVITYPISEK